MRIRTDRTIRAVEFSTSWFASTSNRKVSFQEGVAKQLATPFLQGSLSTDYTDSTKYRCNLWIENRKINPEERVSWSHKQALGRGVYFSWVRSLCIRPRSRWARSPAV